MQSKKRNRNLLSDYHDDGSASGAAGSAAATVPASTASLIEAAADRPSTKKKKSSQQLFVAVAADGDNLTRSSFAGTAGLIQRIELKNFMSFENLAIDFGKKFNVISGASDDAKSAVQRALKIALNTKETQNASTAALRDVIHKHCTEATITLFLSNDSFDAFDPIVFGKQVVLEHRITSAVHVVNILGRDRRIVLTGKDKLKIILQKFGYQQSDSYVPCLFVSQPEAKLIGGGGRSKRDKQELYDMVMRLTHLQDHADRICVVREKDLLLEAEIQTKQAELDTLMKSLNQGIHQLRDLYDKYHTELQNLKEQGITELEDIQEKSHDSSRFKALQTEMKSVRSQCQSKEQDLRSIEEQYNKNHGLVDRQYRQFIRLRAETMTSISMHCSRNLLLFGYNKTIRVDNQDRSFSVEELGEQIVQLKDQMRPFSARAALLISFLGAIKQEGDFKTLVLDGFESEIGQTEVQRFVQAFACVPGSNRMQALVFTSDAGDIKSNDDINVVDMA